MDSGPFTMDSGQWIMDNVLQTTCCSLTRYLRFSLLAFHFSLFTFHFLRVSPTVSVFQCKRCSPPSGTWSGEWFSPRVTLTPFAHPRLSMVHPLRGCLRMSLLFANPFSTHYPLSTIRYSLSIIHYPLQRLFSGFYPVKAAAFDFSGQFGASCFHYSPAHQHVDGVGLQVVEQALVVGDDEGRGLGLA